PQNQPTTRRAIHRNRRMRVIVRSSFVRSGAYTRVVTTIGHPPVAPSWSHAVRLTSRRPPGDVRVTAPPSPPSVSGYQRAQTPAVLPAMEDRAPGHRAAHIGRGDETAAPVGEPHRHPAGWRLLPALVEGEEGVVEPGQDRRRGIGGPVDR